MKKLLRSILVDKKQERARLVRLLNCSEGEIMSRIEFQYCMYSYVL